MKTCFILIFSIFSICISAQKFLDVPKLSDNDVAQTKSMLDPEAPAEILFKSYHYRLDLDGIMYTDIVSRVKIYKKDNAGDFLDHEISIYDDTHGTRETLSGLKAYTYNIENGKVVATKVEKDSKFQSKEDKNYTITKFAFPNVKDGSVVEYSYSILTPFLVSTPLSFIEYKIPVKYIEFVFDTPKQIGYNIDYKGSATPKYREVKEANIYGGEYKVYRFGYVNLPAYKTEEFVLNGDNYRTSLKAELNSTFFGNQLKSYALSWNDIRKRLYEHDDFGVQLKKTNLVKDVLPQSITSISDKYKKAEEILKFVQNNYTFNKRDKAATEDGIRNLLNTKVGNAAEINLLLTMLLRNAGIDANPIVLSTIKLGIINAYNPSIAQLNFVLAGYEDAGKIYILDGTSKLTKINMVSPKAFNYYGVMMTEKEAKQIDIVFPEISETHLTINAEMAPTGSFNGKFSDKDTKLYALSAIDSYEDNKEDYYKTYREKYQFPFTNIQSEKGDNTFVTSFDFDADTFADAIGNKIVFNPMLFLYTQNHAYSQTTERKAPLEFLTRNRKIKKITITLPDGYVFESVPKSKKFRTQENEIQYSYVVTQEGDNKLTIETSTLIDEVVFQKEYYPVFKQLFDNITQMEGQVATVIKK